MDRMEILSLAEQQFETIYKELDIQMKRMAQRATTGRKLLRCASSTP
jgi:hypothetical protein